MDLEDEYKEKIEKRIDVVLSSFKNVLDDNHELLGKTSEELFKAWKPEVDETLTELIYELLYKSWLLGMRHFAEERIQDFADVELNFDYSLTFDEAMTFAGNRIAMTKDQFEKLSADIKCYAFTVGRLSQLDMIEKVQRAYLGQLESSALNIDDFLKNVGTILGKDSGYQKYYELVFRTNIQKDYNAGKAMQMMEDPPLFLEFVGIDDERQSDICAARTGVVLPYTDPWWDNNWPPLHYNCRSTIREIFEDEALERGLIERKTKEERQAEREAYAKLSREEKDEIQKAEELRKKAETEKFSKIDENAPTAGFGRNPARDNGFWNVSQSQQDRVVRDMIQEELNEVAGKTICRDFSSEKEGFTYFPTDRGGIRYENGLEKETEFAGNIQIAEILAKKEGYYVELRDRKILEGNRQFDAWLNGMEKVEFKNLTSKRKETLADEIRKGISQASSLVVRIKYTGQIKPLVEKLHDLSDEMIGRYQTRQIKIIYGDDIVTLSRSDLKDKTMISSKVFMLYPDRRNLT